jgi:hypothetical protein
VFAANLSTALFVLRFLLVVALFGASTAAGGERGKPQRPADITVVDATATSISIT